MKKNFCLILSVLLAALLLGGCSMFAQTGADTAQVPTFKPAEATPAPTAPKEAASIVPVGTVVEEIEPTPTPVDKVVDSAVYLPRVNRRIVMREYNGAQPDIVKYVIAKDGENSEEGYRLASYYEDQAMYYTDYFMTDEGLFGRFSDDEEKEMFLVLPKDITEGMEYELDGQKAVIEKVGADFELEGLKLENCVVVKVQSNAYGKEVTHVYAPELYLACEYIEYDEEVIDIIKIIDSFEDISEEDAQKTVEDSRF